MIKTAQELVNDGMEAFNSQRYRAAIESFDKLKDWYPFSKYAILAELKIADAHFYLGEYEAAIAAYESFENLHPRNDATPYVIFQRGLSYIEQLETVDRDQTSAKKAIETFNRLKKTYPASEYTAQAENYIRLCLKNLAGHEFYVGEFYFKNKHYKAAVMRFQNRCFQLSRCGSHGKSAGVYCPMRNGTGKTKPRPKKKSMVVPVVGTILLKHKMLRPIAVSGPQINYFTPD